MQIAVRGHSVSVQLSLGVIYPMIPYEHRQCPHLRARQRTWPIGADVLKKIDVDAKQARLLFLVGRRRWEGRGAGAGRVVRAGSATDAERTRARELLATHVDVNATGLVRSTGDRSHSGSLVLHC